MVALNKCFCHLSKYYSKIKSNQFFFHNMLAKTPYLFFRKDKLKVEKDINNKDIPIKLTKKVVIDKK